VFQIVSSGPGAIALKGHVARRAVMKIQEFYDPNTYTLTFVVFDEATHDAVVIDPVLDYDPGSSQTSTASVDAVSRFIEKEGLKLHYVLETHAHADHLSSSQILKQRYGAKVAIGARITEVQETFRALFDLGPEFRVDGGQFDKLLADGETVTAGSLAVKVIATPGHTPACVSYLIGDAVFTGDALFMEDYGTGRCDFPRGSAEDLYQSIQKLYALPDATRVFVGHDYQPNGRGLRFETTIGKSKRENVQLRADTTREEFVRFRKTRDATLAAPRLLFPSVQVNVNAGILPRARANGRRYLNIPINLFRPTDDFGNPTK
jgi:glyoxylase-like metal-dependent hydrolase (beta-lactamase superfamily II)